MDKILSAITLIIVVMSLQSCSNGNDSTTVRQNKLEDGTEAMAQELSDLVKNGDPNLYYHWNLKRAKISYDSLNTVSPDKYIETYMKYVIELLNGGESETAIKSLEHLLQSLSISKENYHENYKIFFETLALAYLRNGEQENCLNNHNEYSCIIPLQKEGQHKNRNGSKIAIEYLSFLHLKHPDDFQIRWLLNIAHMTLGSFPQKVPSEARLSIDGRSQFPRFKEIASHLNVAHNGLSGGVCIDDFNNDGWLDIFCTSYGMEDMPKYYVNNKNGGFVDNTSEAGINGIVGGLNCLHADYDNDGDKDILILRGGWLSVAGNHPNSLLRNNGDNTFSDVTYQSGLTSKLPCQTAVFFDYNLDGNLDIFFGNEANKQNMFRSELFKNNGDGTFTEVTESSGIKVTEFVKGVNSGDINNDGYPDLYISLGNGHNLLYLNLKNGTFENVSMTAGVVEPIRSFPTWFCDVNNDGWEDIFVGSYDLKYQDQAGYDYCAELLGVNPREEQARLYLNSKNGTFREVSKEYGLRKSMYAMGCNYGDLDMDGYLDFYIGTGTPHLGAVVPNRMFRNQAGNKFEEVTFSGGFGHIQKGHGVSFADLNNDGDQEIYAVMGGAYEGDVFTNILFDNESKNNWITLELSSDSGNRFGHGARVIVQAGNRKVYRTISNGGSFGSNPLRAEVGLGTYQGNVNIEVRWPDSNKTVTNLSDVKPNQHYVINKQSGKLIAKNTSGVKFDLSENGHHHHHH